MIYERGSFTVVPTKMLKGMNPAAQLVFMWLCHHSNQEGNCFPSIKLISEESGMSRDSVIRATKILIQKGIIVKTSRVKNNQHLSNSYQIIIDGEEQKEVVAHSEGVVANSNKGSRTQQHEVVANSDTNYTQYNYTQLTIEKNLKIKGQGAIDYHGKPITIYREDNFPGLTAFVSKEIRAKIGVA